MRTRSMGRPALWLAAVAVGLTLTTGQASAQTGTKSTGTPPPATTTGGSTAPGLFTLPSLTADQDAALMTEATTLVDLVLTFIPITLTDAEAAFVVEIVYDVLRTLTILEMMFGGSSGG